MLFGDICTKSETYQKEGWFILEEENQVFGKDAEAVDSNMNHESEDFNFYHQNKEEAKKNIDSSSADLSDFIDSLIQDIPDPSAEEVNSGIEKILERTQPTEEQPKIKKAKKVTFKVLFIAALLSMISFSCLYVVGSSHNINIENGFVTFAKETIQVVFFGEAEEKYITVDALLVDLEQHGYKDILFPQEFITKSDEYKVSVPKYIGDNLGEQVSFNIFCGEIIYKFSIHNYGQAIKTLDYVGMNSVQTITLGEDISLYMFNFDDNDSAIELIYESYHYFIKANIPYVEMVIIANSIE